MAIRETITRYSLIIKKLKISPSSFQDISKYLQYQSALNGYTYNKSIRTFQRDIQDINSLYCFDIRFNRSKNVYYIDSSTEPELKDRMLEAFELFNVLNHANGLANYIQLETHSARGTNQLNVLLNAIKNQQLIKFQYQKFYESEANDRNVEPLLLKEYKFRWYLIAKDLNSNKIRTFGLDRIYNVTSSNRKFKTSNIQEIKDSFKNSFGIICPENGIVKEIILAFEPEQGQYIKSLPLHLSQEILKDNHDEVWVKLNLFITQDFIIELLSHGAALTVLKPKSLANTIKKIHERAAQNY